MRTSGLLPDPFLITNSASVWTASAILRTQSQVSSPKLRSDGSNSGRSLHKRCEGAIPSEVRGYKMSSKPNKMLAGARQIILHDARRMFGCSCSCCCTNEL